VCADREHRVGEVFHSLVEGHKLNAQ
jgi:hypothetical protein